MADGMKRLDFLEWIAEEYAADDDFRAMIHAALLDRVLNGTEPEAAISKAWLASPLSNGKLTPQKTPFTELNG